MRSETSPWLLGALVALWAAPDLAHGQAEPAPPGSVPSAPASSFRGAPSVPRVRVAADLRFAGLFGDVRNVAAPLGWGFGLQLSASLLPIGPLRFGFVIDFAQDRFSRTLVAYPDSPQLLLHNTFAVQALFDLPSRYLRPYLAFGPGLSAARHESPLPDLVNLMPQTLELATAALLRLSVGLGIAPHRAFELGLSGEFSFTFSDERGGVIEDELMPMRAAAPLFAPGWGALTTWAAYRFY